MIRLCMGWDDRESIGAHAFVESVREHCTEAVAITPLTGQQRDGSNAFTYVRFLVPAMCKYDGWAIYADGSDMLLRADLAELWWMRDERYAVQVVKHDYRTRHPRKYVGTEMESANADYPRKNWSSLILWNAGHVANRCLTAEFVDGQSGAFLHRFGWLEDSQIGELPVDWNWLADEYGENRQAKLCHWTTGQPGFYHYRNAPHADEWKAAVRKVTRGMA